VTVVLGHYASDIAAALAGLDIQIVHNPSPDDGLVSSQRLGLQAQTRFGEQDLGWLGVPQLGSFADSQVLADHVQSVLGRPVVMVAGKVGPLQRIAWCTGGAQGYFEAAIAAGADAFITGEISEPQAHYARECGVTFIACGHHASERYGAPALAGQVAQQLGIAHAFIDVDNPA
jgi:putative NIF3 family GTP cyclohydrolase 1 type 2